MVKSTKSKVIAGTALVAGLASVGSIASADETTDVVTTDNPATNLVTAQEVATPENTVAASQAGTQEGTIVTPVESTGLDQAVSDAQAAGVVVEETPMQTVDSLEQADTNLAQQEQTVEAATETQQEVDTRVAQAEQTAKDAGVQTSKSNEKVYEDNAAAKADATAQAENAKTVAEAQKTADTALSTAISIAKEAGVEVNLGKDASYSDAKQALDDLSKQVATLTSATSTQKEVDQAIATAISDARKAGVEVTLGQSKSVSDLQAALSEAKAQVEKLSAAQAAQDKANGLISDTVANAQAKGTVVKNTGTVTVSSSEAEAKAQEIVNKVQAVVAENEAIAKANQEASQNYEQSKTDVANKNAEIEAKNAEIRKSNAEKQAAYEKAKEEADAKNAETQARNAEIRKSNEEKQAAYEESLKKYQDAISKKETNVTDDVTIKANFSADNLDTLSGTTIKDRIVWGKNGEFTIYYPSDDGNGTFENLVVKGKVNYKATYNEKTDSAAIVITSVTIDSYQSVVTRPNGAVQTYHTDSLYDPNGKLIYTYGRDGLSTSAVQKINKTFTLDKKIEVKDGQTSTTFLMLHNVPNWVVEANSYLRVSFTYNSDIDIPEKPEKPQLEEEPTEGLVTVAPPVLEDELPPVKDTVTPPTLKTPKEVEIQTVKVAETASDIVVQAVAHNIQMTADLHDVTVKTKVNPVQVAQKPTNVKAVNNMENVDINGNLVAKASQVKWVLSNESLKAGRDNTVSYVMSDPLPQGFTLNLLATAEATPDYNVKYDKANNLLTFTAKDATLYALNADLASNVTIPVATIIGTVDNDAATYQNTFTTIVTTAETVIVDDHGKVTPQGKTETYKVVSNTPVVYTPGSDYRTYNGNVVVRYFEEGTNVKIAPNQVDEEDAKVGTSYDTTDQKQEFIGHDGKTYEFTGKTVGEEQGKVINGTIYVDYFYKVKEPVKGEGNVIVHYINEDGQTIKNDVEDTPNSPVGTEYDTTDNKPKTITTEDGIEYEIVVEKTMGDEEGDVVQGTTEVTYVYKRLTPKPETPTPTDSKIDPEKHIYTEDGQQVDGKTLLPNTKVNYTARWDLDQYKDIVNTDETVAKGFAYIDVLQNDTVAIDDENITATLADGTAVKGLKFYKFENFKEIKDEKLLNLINNSGIDLTNNNGEVRLWVAENPQEFYETYVVTGQNIYIGLPVVTGDYVGTFDNEVFQIDFGNGYQGNIVENNIPKLEAIKDVLKSIGSGESINNANVELGQVFPYSLDGPAVNANIVGGLQEYKFHDDFDEEHDEYNGEFYAFAQQDIVLKDGTVIKAGDEITKYFVQNITRNEDGKATAVDFTVDPAFLALIDEDGVFDPIVYMMAKRIAYAENVENTFTVTINGYEVVSNKVVTHTPKPEEPKEPTKPVTPVTPTAVTPTPEAPAPEQPALPATGDSNGNAQMVGLAMLLATILSWFGLGQKRKEN